MRADSVKPVLKKAGAWAAVGAVLAAGAIMASSPRKAHAQARTPARGEKPKRAWLTEKTARRRRGTCEHRSGRS